jgi:hypothetical protein
MRTWLTAGNLTIKVQRTVAGAYEKIDGTNTTYKMNCPNGWSDHEKVAAEDQEVYIIDKIFFEEAGVRSA